jgi:hypothetical protein
MDVNDEASVLEILHAAQIRFDQLDDRTLVDHRGRVVTLRLNPCIGLQELPSCIGDLSQLEEVYLFWGGINFVRLPRSMEQLSKLKILQLRWCLSLTSVPTSLGAKLTSLEELILEGCSSLEDLSCLKDARHRWIHLQCLKIIACPNVNFTETFIDIVSEEGESDIPDFFPSMTRLCLRRNAICGEALSNIWSFFQRCPRLTTVDVSDNHIDTLKHLAQTCLLRRRLSCSLRGLNLAGNPVLKVKRSAETTTTTIQKNCEPKYVLQIVQSHTHLESLVACHNQRRTTPTSNSECLATSSLYSPEVQHALDLNHASRGNALHLLREDTSAKLSLSMWPMILERTTLSRVSSWDATLSWCHRCAGSDGSQLRQRKASVVFSLLQGPVFAARGGN